MHVETKRVKFVESRKNGRTARFRFPTFNGAFCLFLSTNKSEEVNKEVQKTNMKYFFRKK